jgi:hypothetical protein
VTTNKNVELLDSTNGTFRVLDFINIRMPRGIAEWWHTEDIEEDGNQGTLFTGVDETAKPILVIQIGDATHDNTEPDISAITEADVDQLDKFLHEQARKSFDSHVMSLTEWMSSSLNEPQKFPFAKYLASVYKFTSADQEMIALGFRARINDRNAVLVGITDVDNQDAVGAIVSTLAATIIENQAG